MNRRGEVDWEVMAVVAVFAVIVLVMLGALILGVVHETRREKRENAEGIACERDGGVYARRYGYDVYECLRIEAP